MRTLTKCFTGFLAALVALGAIGCALFNKSATPGEKAAQLQQLCYAAASVGAQEACLQNPSWKTQFAVAYEQLDHLVTQKIITGATLRAVLAALPVRELRSQQARIAIESATVLYDATVGTKVNLEAQPYVLAAATGIRDGLKAALGL